MTVRSLLLAFLVAAPLGLAGCLDTAAPGAATESEDAAGLAIVEPDVAVSVDGALAAQVLVCPAVACVGRALVGESDRFFPQESIRDLASADLTLEWDATSPFTERLRLGVFTCADPCKSDADLSDIRFVDGPSPLSFTTDAMTVPEGEKLFAFVWVPSFTPAPVYGVLSTPQGFHVEGTLTPGTGEPAAESSPILYV